MEINDLNLPQGAILTDPADKKEKNNQLVEGANPPVEVAKNDADEVIISREGRAAGATLSSPFDTVSFSTSSATAKIGIDTVTFSNANGNINWNGSNLNLKGIGDARSDDLIFQKDGMYINVYKGSDSYRLNMDGS